MLTRYIVALYADIVAPCTPCFNSFQYCLRTCPRLLRLGKRAPQMLMMIDSGRVMPGAHPNGRVHLVNTMSLAQAHGLKVPGRILRQKPRLMIHITPLMGVHKFLPALMQMKNFLTNKSNGDLSFSARSKARLGAGRLASPTNQ